MAKSPNKTSKLTESFGGYMSVDPIQAIEQNWEIIKELALPNIGLEPKTTVQAEKENNDHSKYPTNSNLPNK